MGSGAHAGRIEQWIRCGAGGRARDRGHRRRHVRIDQKSCRALRCRRHEVNLRPRQPPRHRDNLVVPRSRGSDDAIGVRQRTAAQRACGSRSARRLIISAASADYTRALTRGVRGVRMGIPKLALIDDYHADVKRAFDEALTVFKKLGASIVEADMPPTLAVIDDVQTIVRIAEASSYHESFLSEKAERYGKTDVRRDVEAGSLITATQYLRAQKVRTRFVKEFTALFDTFDVFLTP